uniref:F-box domain-containing protein n=1 Tax=Ascaris lumbricoides TaxID=6252 RepID=A0A9J2PC23_ASCLU
MIKSLFNICLSVVCQNRVDERLACLPSVCKQRLLEFFSSHDQLFMADCLRLVSSQPFEASLTSLYFFLSEQLTDDMLAAIAMHNPTLEVITIIDCPKVTDQGILNITNGQRVLGKLELRASGNLTSSGLSLVNSERLHTVDLSSCFKFSLVHVAGLCDQALYDIAHYLGDSLAVLELDFLPNLIDPGTTLYDLSRSCPNIRQLSLCRFFEGESDIDELQAYEIAGMGLLDVDLYGNHFFTLPQLPPTVTRLRLSVCGDENVDDLVSRLQMLPQLNSVHLQLSCKDESWRSMDEANAFLCAFIPLIGSKITRLQVSLPRLVDTAFTLITQCMPNLIELALDVKHINNKLLRHFFSGGIRSPGARLLSLKLCRLRITYRALFAIARGARSITDLETSHMPCVDDRFLALLADNCRQLNNVNFNGCRFVTDKGLAALARNCCLKEVRIRATSCTDKSIYLLAQFCPDLEWISHADFSGRPKFSDQALQCLRDSCVQRVIC